MKKLSEHIIKEVKAAQIRNRFPRLIGKNAKRVEHGYGYTDDIVIITTDTGFTGWGLGRADRSLKLSLEGKALSQVFDPAIGILDMGYSAADIALHDLAGKILGISVSKMLNPKSTMRALVYDGAIYLDELRANGEDWGVEHILKNCRDDAALGYADFKLKLGRGSKWMEPEAGLKRDVEITRAIRKEYPDAKILVDFNDELDVDTVIRYMEQVKDCDIFWIEEGFRENYDDCMKLKAYLKKNSPQTLLADGEANYDRAESMDLAARGAVEVLLMDIISYSLTEWRAIMEKCRAQGIKCSPHSWGLGLKTRTVCHIAAAFPDICPAVEGVPDTTEGVDYSGYTLKDGIMTIEDRPGFGMDLEYARPVEIWRPY